MEISPINHNAFGHAVPAPAASPAPAAREVDASHVIEAQAMARQAAAEREKLVMRPGQVSLEDRLEQVISLEDMKQLLNLQSPEHARQASVGPGMLFDLRV